MLRNMESLVRKKDLFVGGGSEYVSFQGATGTDQT